MTTTAASAPSQPRILVAGDDDDVRRLVAGALRTDGYEIVEISGVERLMMTLAERPGRATIALVVSDIQAPARAALRTLQQIRARGWQVPVILLTAPADIRTRLQAATLGALIMSKPPDVGALRATIDRLLRGQLGP